MLHSSGPPFARVDHGQRRIIVADDDLDLRALLADALEQSGYEVFQASSGSEVVDAVRCITADGKTVDLLISDLRMPKMDGLFVLKLLRDAEFDMPVLLLTAFSDSETRREASAFGARVLDKPLHLHTLCREVARALAENVDR